MTAGHKFHKIERFDDSSFQHRLPHPGSEEFNEALKFVGFSPKFKPTFELDFGFDIPYLCGYDTEEPEAYFDKDFDPSSYEEGDATDTLLSHEEIEKLLEDFEEAWNYEQRHHVATWCEMQLVDARGWDRKKYNEWTTRSWHASYAKWKGRPSGLVIPDTLDMSPYVDEHDSIIKLMRSAGAKDTGNER